MRSGTLWSSFVAGTCHSFAICSRSTLKICLGRGLWLIVLRFDITWVRLFSISELFHRFFYVDKDLSILHHVRRRLFSSGKCSFLGVKTSFDLTCGYFLGCELCTLIQKPIYYLRILAETVISLSKCFSLELLSWFDHLLVLTDVVITHRSFLINLEIVWLFCRVLFVLSAWSFFESDFDRTRRTIMLWHTWLLRFSHLLACTCSHPWSTATSSFNSDIEWSRFSWDVVHSQRIQSEGRHIDFILLAWAIYRWTRFWNL